MAYLNLICTFTVGRTQKEINMGRPTKDGEDWHTAVTKEILEEYPKAKNIVVVEEPKNEGFPYAIDTLMAFIMKQRPDITREMLEDVEYCILTESRNEYRRGAYIVSLEEAKVIFDDENSDWDDWVYIRDMESVIFNITKHTSHHVFLAHWYHILTKVLSERGVVTKAKIERRLWNVDFDRDSEKFLEAGLGFFQTSAYGVGHITKSADMKMTPEEKAAFGDFKVREI